MSASYFQYRCYNEHPFIKERAEDLFKLYQAGRNRKLKDKHDKAAIRRAFKVALAGLFLGGAYDDHGSFVRISLNNNNYYGQSRLSPVFRSELLKVFRWLIDEEYITCVSNTYHDPITQREIPRGYRLTDSLMASVENHKEVARQVRLQTTRNSDASFIELRDDDKRCLRLKPSAQNALSKPLLTWYDEELNNHTFTIANQGIPPFYLSLTRIYSQGSYELGGRFYSLFQGLRSQSRLHLQIDGEHVFEVDLSSLHPTMLYRKAGLHLEHDPYEVEGFPRSVVKVAMQVLLNTTKPFPPANSLRYYLAKAKRSKRNRNDKAWQEIDFTTDYCHQLALAVAARNKPITEFFSQGIGLKLQHLDSIFTSCILHFVKKTSPSTVVIPIHDSYVIKQSELSILLDALEFAESTLTKLQGWDPIHPKIKIESVFMDDLSTYESILEERSLDVGSTTVKEEDITSQLEEFMLDQDLDEQECEDAYDLDAGYEHDQ
jgi:hypothetical protein